MTTPKRRKAYAIMFPDGQLYPGTFGIAKKARDYAYMFLPSSDPDHSWQHCYKLGYRVIAVDIVPRKR